MKMRNSMTCALLVKSPEIRFRALLLLLLATVLVGCGPTRRMYEGPERPRDQVGVITRDGRYAAYFQFVDGKMLVSPMWATRLEFLPGKHELGIGLSGWDGKHSVYVERAVGLPF